MASIKQQQQEVVLMGPYLLKSSATFSVGEFVAFSTSTAGVLDNANAAVAGTIYVCGLLEKITDKDGNPLLDSSGSPLTSVNTPVSNSTYYGVIIPTYNYYTFEVPADATLGTTTGSDKPGVYFDLASSTRVAENSVVLPAGTGAPKQLLSLGPAVDKTTGGTSSNTLLVKFVKSIWQKA